jgi:hypothetical protein
MTIVINNEYIDNFCKKHPLFVPEDILLFHIKTINQLNDEIVTTSTIQKSLENFMNNFQAVESNKVLNKITLELENIKGKFFQL